MPKKPKLSKKKALRQHRQLMEDQQELGKHLPPSDVDGAAAAAPAPGAAPKAAAARPKADVEPTTSAQTDTTDAQESSAGETTSSSLPTTTPTPTPTETLPPEYDPDNSDPFTESHWREWSSQMDVAECDKGVSVTQDAAAPAAVAEVADLPPPSTATTSNPDPKMSFAAALATQQSKQTAARAPIPRTRKSKAAAAKPATSGEATTAAGAAAAVQEEAAAAAMDTTAPAEGDAAVAGKPVRELEPEKEKNPAAAAAAATPDVGAASTAPSDDPEWKVQRYGKRSRNSPAAKAPEPAEKLVGLSPTCSFSDPEIRDSDPRDRIDRFVEYVSTGAQQRIGYRKRMYSTPVTRTRMEEEYTGFANISGINRVTHHEGDLLVHQIEDWRMSSQVTLRELMEEFDKQRKGVPDTNLSSKHPVEGEAVTLEDVHRAIEGVDGRARERVDITVNHLLGAMTEWLEQSDQNTATLSELLKYIAARWGEGADVEQHARAEDIAKVRQEFQVYVDSAQQNEQSLKDLHQAEIASMKAAVRKAKAEEEVSKLKLSERDQAVKYWMERAKREERTSQELRESNRRLEERVTTQLNAMNGQLAERPTIDEVEGRIALEKSFYKAEGEQLKTALDQHKAETAANIKSAISECTQTNIMTKVMTEKAEQVCKDAQKNRKDIEEVLELISGDEVAGGFVVVLDEEFLGVLAGEDSQ